MRRLQMRKIIKPCKITKDLLRKMRWLFFSYAIRILGWKTMKWKRHIYRWRMECEYRVWILLILCPKNYPPTHVINEPSKPPILNSQELEFYQLFNSPPWRIFSLQSTNLLSNQKTMVVSPNADFQVFKTLIKFKQCWNLIVVTTFVIISAGFSVVCIFWICIWSFSRISLTKWYLTSICFILAW